MVRVEIRDTEIITLENQNQRMVGIPSIYDS
jgi:hypothetical protein